MLVFIAVIFLCQAAIEAKVYLMNKAEEKADTLAAAAFRQINDATIKLHTLSPSELQVSSQF